MSIKLMEHINISILDGEDTSTRDSTFYLEVLGCVPDYRSQKTLHVNMGLNQFHLPIRAKAQRINGEIGLFFPNLKQLLERLERWQNKLQLKCTDSPFSYQHIIPALNTEANVATNAWEFSHAKILYEHVIILGPNGNKFVCFESPCDYRDISEMLGKHPGGKAFGDGIPYIKIFIKPNTASGISRFYQDYMHASALLFEIKNEDGTHCGDNNKLKKRLNGCQILCGDLQRLVFIETTNFIAPYDGHHICIYIDGFEEFFHRLDKDGLIYNPQSSNQSRQSWTEVQNAEQFRFLRVIDPLTHEHLLDLEHEVRSQQHPASPLLLN